ncbi:MAG: PIN domain-containing protein [Thermodesulfobacteriota bacterium]|nr:PIN domain-containing protein [Thermodesulfobacteriota bacterium]
MQTAKIFINGRSQAVRLPKDFRFSDKDVFIKKNSSKPEQIQIALTQFVAPLEVLPYGDEAAHYYGLLRVYLEKHGTPIGSLDMLIAAYALSINCTLVTNNEEGFSRISNLRMNDRKRL